MGDDTTNTGRVSPGDDERPDAVSAREVTVVERRALAPRRRNDVAVRPRASLPVPVKRVAAAVAVGAAMQVGLSLAGKYLAAQAGKQAAKGLLSQAQADGHRNGSPAEQAPLDDVGAVTETLIVQRVWYRRGR